MAIGVLCARVRVEEKQIIAALERAGMVNRMFTQDQIDWAVDNPPQDTRAKARGEAVSHDEALRQGYGYKEVSVDELMQEMLNAKKDGKKPH